MIKAFKTSYSLKNTYRVNTIIYLLKSIPLIKKLIPSTLYKSKGLKTFAGIISFLYEILSLFAGKAIYMFLLIFLLSTNYSNHTLAFTNILFFLTIIGGFLNTYLFAPSNDKYYAIILMRFDAKKYIVSNYIYFNIKTILGFMPFTIIFGLITGISLPLCILLPFIICLIKNIIVYFGIKFDKDVYKEDKLTRVSIIVATILLALGYGLPVLNIGITEMILYYLMIIIIPFGIYSFYYIITYNKYDKIAKNILKRENLIGGNNPEAENNKQYAKTINAGEIISNKTGYEYFNDIFVQRHKKILSKSTKTVSLITFVVFIGLIIVSFINNSIGKQLNDFLKFDLPYYLFVMYFINRGQVITRTMFMNCDHSMLMYRFYREPFAILSLFKARLKVLVFLNLIPGFIMAIGSVLLLMVTGGASNIIYLVTFVSIIFMTIFFSIHYLVLYYLLQPFNVNLESKDPTYGAICTLTYFVCFMATKVQVPVLLFGTCMIIFTILYSIISLILVYKYATKTFKLRN